MIIEDSISQKQDGKMVEEAQNVVEVDTIFLSQTTGGIDFCVLNVMNLDIKPNFVLEK